MGVGPVVRHVVRQRHITDAEAVKFTQCGERILDRIAALDAHQHAHFARAFRTADLSGRRAHRELLGMPLGLSIGRVDHIHRPRHRAACLPRLAADVDRKELAGDAARLESRQVGVEGRSIRDVIQTGARCRQVVIVIGHRRRNVVVAVDDDRLAMYFQGLCPQLWIGVLWHRLGGNSNAK